MSIDEGTENLEALRHSAAHLLAAAVLELWPDAKLTIGPATADGFYYDIDFGEAKVSEDDFKQIEKEMKRLVQGWKEFSHQEVSAEEARAMYADNPFKLELVEEIAGRGEAITLYTAGEFTDLCRGGHVESPSKALQHFKLLKVAGAYWRGSEDNPMLTRIYGTAFESKQELDDYLTMLEEAKKRDHRKLGQQLDLFTFSPLVGAGLPLFTPRGTVVRHELDQLVWELRQGHGYERVEIPHITKKDLFEKSGHWEKFGDELFKIATREGHEFAMKPMNCPFHTQIFDRKLHSYKEMPQRYANTTMVYRDEQTGELQGLSRVRAITQDDAHVFCRESQFVEEALKIWDIIEKFYATTGFGELKVRLSLRDPEQPEKYQGSEEIWQKTENQLREIISQKGVEFTEVVGEAAFYGPKIDFISRDSLGREWQVATIQADRVMPENFDLACIDEQGNRERVVMIHAAIMGAIERFLSILIEHHGGAFPLWLSPLQVAVLPITDNQLPYAEQVASQLKEAGVRVEVDSRSESVGKKIREAETMKTPVMVVVGQKEVEAGTVAVRERGNREQRVVPLAEFLEELRERIERRS